jgi:hypothetical protein
VDCAAAESAGAGALHSACVRVCNCWLWLVAISKHGVCCVQVTAILSGGGLWVVGCIKLFMHSLPC